MPLGFDINNFNSFIEQAQDKILCNADCQKQKTSEQLKQDYLNAKNNLLTAPNQVEETEKKYVTFTQGELAYNDLESNKITETASTISTKFQEKFNNEVQKIQSQIQGYTGLLVNFKNVVELYIKYKKENIALFKKLKDETSDLLTNERKTFYEDQGIDNLKFIYHYIILTIYIIFVIAFGSFSLMFPTSAFYNWKVKLFLFIAFIILPFVATYILDFIIGFFNFLYNLLPKNVRLTI